MNIPLFKIYRDAEDVKAVSRVVRDSQYWTEGPCVQEFEKKLAEYLGVPYCVSFNSGTSALHAALLAAGIQKGDEVVVPSFTFIATANIVLMCGAKPVFDDDTWPSDAKTCIPVHPYGCPCGIPESAVVIEDACEALGSDINGKKVGTFGLAGVFSFCANKIISTGEGGAVVTKQQDIYEQLKLLRSHGRSQGLTANAQDYVRLGYNYRMTEYTAALALSQLSKIELIIAMRRQVADWYKEKLEGIPDILVPCVPRGYRHVYQLFTIRVLNGKRDKLQAYLATKSIASKVYFYPVHQTTFYRSLGYDIHLPITEMMSREVLSLPMYPELKQKEVDYIAQAIKEFMCKE